MHSTQIMFARHPLGVPQPPPGSAAAAALPRVPPLVKPLKIGSLVRVKPEVKSPKFGWGSVSHASQGRVTSIHEYSAVLGDYVKVDFPQQAGWAGLASEMMSVD